MDKLRTVITSLMILCVTGLSFAALGAPNQIHTQGVLRDANGDLMTGELDVVFGIYDSQMEGQVLWDEQVTLVLHDGVFDVLLPADPANSPFPADLFEADGRWLSIIPTDQNELPRTRLSAVPYALQANMAENLQCSGCISPEEVDFNYASSDAPGGSATSALIATEAMVAANVDCLGCITLQAIDATVLTADNIGYNNAISGLAASTAQDAIDENALTIAAHSGDASLHGAGGGGADGAKIRVVKGDVDIRPGQSSSDYVHVFSADTPRVYLYAYGKLPTDWDGPVQPTDGGTVIYTRCPWTGSHAKNVSSCTPAACPADWVDLGVTGSVKTGGTAFSYSSYGISNTSYTASHGFQERACYNPGAYAVVLPRCPWTGSHAKKHGSCAPSACPEGWEDMGVTGNIKTGGTAFSYSSYGISNTSYTASHGYQERTCLKFIETQTTPKGVQIWIDGEDRTAAIGDQQGVGAPDWSGSAWGSDGATPWATGRLDISQVIDWGVGEHSLEFKNTGDTGGRILYFVYLVDPAGESQAFPNDGCQGAQSLVFDGSTATVNGTTEDMLGENKAVDNLSPEGCGGEGGGDVVYSAVVEERATLTATVAAPFATRTYILDSPCQDETVLACDANEATTAELDPGTYYVVVDSDSADQTGDFGLTVHREASPLPTNDTCDTAQAIDAGVNPIQVSGTTKWGLDQFNGSCGGDGASDVVYSFEATDANDDLVVNITAPFSPVLVLRAQNCDGGFQLSCSTNGTLSIAGLAPGIYYLYVDGATVEDEGDFTLDVTLN